MNQVDRHNSKQARREEVRLQTQRSATAKAQPALPSQADTQATFQRVLMKPNPLSQAPATAVRSDSRTGQDNGQQAQGNRGSNTTSGTNAQASLQSSVQGGGKPSANAAIQQGEPAKTGNSSNQPHAPVSRSSVASGTMSPKSSPSRIDATGGSAQKFSTPMLMSPALIRSRLAGPTPLPVGTISQLTTAAEQAGESLRSSKPSLTAAAQSDGMRRVEDLPPSAEPVAIQSGGQAQFKPHATPAAMLQALATAPAIQQLIQYAAVHQNRSGAFELHLGIMGGARLCVTALGRKRVSVRLASEGTVDQGELSDLLEGLRRRGIEVVEASLV